jgi:hypothetical protein
MGNRMKKQGQAAAIAAIAIFARQEFARSALTLTAAANASGYTLTTFASGFPNESNIGPLGIAFTSNGGVMVCDTLGNNRIFPTDTDGQTIAAAPVVATYGDSASRTGPGFNVRGRFAMRDVV